MIFLHLGLFHRRLVRLDPLFASVDNSLRGLFCGLVEHVKDHNRHGADVVEDSPLFRCVLYAEFMAISPDTGHRPGMRQVEELAPLEPAQKKPDLLPCFLGQGRSLNFAVEPDQGLVDVIHPCNICRIRHIVKVIISQKSKHSLESRNQE
jgi:hypothetical protein